MRDKPIKPDITYEGKKYWIRDVDRYTHYSNEFDYPVRCESYDILYWDDTELTGDEDVWDDSEFCEKLEKKTTKIFGEYDDSPY